MLRVASTALAESSTGGAAGGGSSSFFSVDTRRKQVTLFDPAACGGASSAPEDRRVGVAAPKMFAFDAIFTSDDSQVCLITNHRPYNQKLYFFINSIHSY